LRAAAERESLWQHLLAGDVDVVASDHSPAPPAMKTGDNFFGIWGGIAGVESTLAVLIHAGHFARGLPLERIARLTAAYPAERFRLPHKGSIAPGCDADLALVDLAAWQERRREELYQRHRFSPYAGTRFRGAIRRTMRRGRTIYADGRITAGDCGRLVRPAPALETPYATTRTHS